MVRSLLQNTLNPGLAYNETNKISSDNEKSIKEVIKNNYQRSLQEF